MDTPNPPPARGLNDPDFDPFPSRPRRTWRRQYGTYQGYQRLVANPFLGMLWVIGWFVAVTRIVHAKRLALFWPALASLGVVYFLLQFHCLDCGATGLLGRWRRHACARVRARYEAGFGHRVRFPTPSAQVIFWFYLTLIGSTFFYIIHQ